MKTKMFFAGLVLLAASSCSSVNDDMVNNVLPEETVAPVMVHVDAFSVEQGNFPETRGTAVGDYASLKALTLAFYRDNGTEVYKHTQFKSDASTYTTFGEFSCSLGLGSYTMVVLGYGSDSEISLTSPTTAAYTADAVRDTFAATQEVTITNSEAKNLTATLNRIVSAIAIISTDERAATVTAIRTTLSGGSKSFNPTTGLATDNAGIVNRVTTTAIGVTQTANYVFLASNEQTMNVTIETLDADNHVLFSKTINDVPVKINRLTRLTGAIYSPSASATAGSFELNTEWLSSYTMNF